MQARTAEGHIHQNLPHSKPLMQAPPSERKKERKKSPKNVGNVLNLQHRLHVRERPRPESAQRTLGGRGGRIRRPAAFSEGDLPAGVQGPGEAVGFAAGLAVGSQLTAGFHLRALVLAGEFDGAREDGAAGGLLRVVAVVLLAGLPGEVALHGAAVAQRGACVLPAGRVHVHQAGH